jgi:trans-aconitate methyltransferase
LELGCGLGTKLLIASWAGIQNITGIESNPQYAAIADEMVRTAYINAKILAMDIRDFKQYHLYDIIYSYSPLRLEPERSFIEQLRTKMKKGATLIEVSCFVEPKIWVKK